MRDFLLHDVELLPATSTAVTSDVSLERVFFGELHPAQEAGVRKVLLDASQTVVLKFIVLHETLVADLALEVLNAIVTSFMGAPVSPLCKSFVAYGTLERLVSVVQLLVVMQAAVYTKLSATHVAGEWHLSGVRSRMRVQIDFASECFPACRAGIRFDALVNRHVSCHVRW